MLVDGQGFTTSMAGNQLQFGIGQAAVPGEPCNTLVPEGVGSGFHPGLFGIFLDDLLNPPGGEFAVPPRLEEPAVVRVGRDMGSQGRGEGLAEENVAVLAAFALIDKDFAVLQVDFGHFNPAQLAHPDPGIEDQPEHEGMLNIFGSIHDLIEPAKLISG